MPKGSILKPEQDPVLDENRRIRRLRMVSDLMIQLLLTRTVSLAEAEDMISGIRKMTCELFPGKEDVFDLIYMPRFRRALREAGYSRNTDLRLIQGGKSQTDGS
jgi:hypothetical protein